MSWRFATWLVLAASATFAAHAQRQMEKLGRGVVGVRISSSQVYVGWRLLGGESEDIAFNLYRASPTATNLVNAVPITNSCNLIDGAANLSFPNAYFIRPVIDSVEQPPSATFTLPANSPTQQYLNVPLQQPAGGTTADGVSYSYNANDCSVGDLDGDGEYEIILKWDPSNSKDNSQSGFTGNVYLDAYKLNGTRLWRIDLGPNIRAGAHYTQFMVYDLDGDGRAEIACKTAPGTKDGLGNNVIMPGDNPNAVYTNASGYILAGPEYFTIFDGLTGRNLATTNYVVPRGTVSSWGDSYGNRVDRFLACVAYLDGVRPSVVMCRGYYTRAVLAAWDWRNGQLTQRWVFDTGFSGGPWSAYKGQGSHCLTVGDVDADGKDEITYGACAIDDNGVGLYSTGLGHGDALHLSDMDPDRPGLEVWMVHEDPGSYGSAGLEFRDARTGSLIFGVDGQNSDVGRGVAIDIDPRYPGYEMWGSRGGLMNASGTQISSSHPSPINFACWWDTDSLREILDGTAISKWNPANNTSSAILSPAGLASNNGTKSTPALSADILGDWREEVIWRTSDNQNLRIYTTTTVATNRIYTLMHDPQYRCAIAWQNVGYNQPPHPGFYLGPQMYPPPLAPTSSAQLAWRGGNGGNAWEAGNNWFANGVWTNNFIASFTSGSSVLFDLRASNNTTVTYSSVLIPGDITVYSPSSITFSGNGNISGPAKLRKAGPGRLTIATTNDYAGGTFVSGGQLIVNGSLAASPVTIEARGDPWGRARIGGGGWLGQGLIVQRDCGVMVGPATNAPGWLTISNGLTELGGVLNQFDLSRDSTGVSGSNDLLQVLGSVVLTGTNTIEVTQTGGFLGGGVYPLITYTGVLTGGLTNLALVGSFIQPVALTNAPGMIGLLAVLPAGPPNAPSGLTATAVGAFQINLAWTDTSSDENALLIERSPGNTASFTQIAAVAPNATSYQDIGLSANATYYYRLRGTNLAGFSAYSNTNSATTAATPPSLIWRGDGAQNVWDVAATANWRDAGTQTLYADGSFVTFDQSGSNTPAINLATIVSPGALIVNASKNYTFSGNGSINGTVALGKSGSGSLTINNTNTFTGGIKLTNGTVIPGSAGANSAGLGYGAITFYGGVLEFTGWTGNSGNEYGGNTNAYVIPAGETGTIRVPQRFSSGLAGPLTGAGTLNLQVKYLRGDISGNWANFAGRINVSSGSGGATVDDFRVDNANGFPNARLNLGTNVLMYSRATANSIIPIGEFSGALGATVTAGGCSGNCGAGTENAVTWRVGGLNTDATNAALFSGTTSLIKEGAGKWTVTRDNTYSGTTTVNGGTLLVNGDQSAATGNVTVNSSGILAGNGVIGGNTTVSGRLAPGVSGIGTLSFSGNLAFNTASVATFEINRSPFANDEAIVGGTANYNGVLRVLNTSVELLEAGDNFQLFSAPAYSGAFTTFDLSPLDEGLAWNMSRLAVDGRVWVVSTNPPVISSVAQAGADLVISGHSGTPAWSYYVLTSTNATLPLSAWAVVQTNQFESSGTFVFSAAIDPAARQRFYRVYAP